MKFISQHERIRELSAAWAGESTLTMAEFYFYHLGTSEQKSQQGLLRSLLHDILKPNLALTSKLVPAMWKDALALKDNETLALPSTAELKCAFQKLTESQLEQWKFCFFIDGLDEFSGNLSDGIEILSSLGESVNIKVIVSSRPLQACVRAFSSLPQLRLENLTRGDMMRYIDKILGPHPYIRSLHRQDPLFLSKLRTELVRKSSGVFLWLKLVCRTLLEGFDNYDRPAELQQRIIELPEELADLFEHMLKKISRPYQVYALSILNTCRASHLLCNNEIDVLSFAVADYHELDVSRIGGIHPRDETNDVELCLALEGRIRSRCCGLVEVKTIDQTSCSHDQSQFDPLFGTCWECDLLVSCTHGPQHWNHVTRECDKCKERRLSRGIVGFVHRSLLEYMETAEFDHFVTRMKLKELEHDPYVALSCIIFHSHAMRATRLDKDEEKPWKQEALLNTFLAECLAKVQPASLRSMKHMCFELGRLDGHLRAFIDDATYKPKQNHPTSRDKTAVSVALLLTAELPFVDLFDAVWKEAGMPELSSIRLGASPLYHAVAHPLLKTCKILPAVVPALLRYLLLAGCDANEECSDVVDIERFTTPWIQLLQNVRGPQYLQCILEGDPDLFRLFLDRGAHLDPARAMIEISTGLNFREMCSSQFVGPAHCQRATKFPNFWITLAKAVHEQEPLDTSISPQTAMDTIDWESALPAMPSQSGTGGQTNRKRRANDSDDADEREPPEKHLRTSSNA